MKDFNKHEELQTRREFFKKTAKGALPFLAFSVFGPSILTSCESDDDDDFSSGSSKKEIPTSLNVGTSILLSHVSSMGFRYFRTISPTQGQWSNTEEEQISQRYSLATFKYQMVGSNQAQLTSINYQASSGRSWSIELDLTYTTYNSGTYKLRDTPLATGKTYNDEGTFKIRSNSSNTGNGTCTSCSSGCTKTCSDNCVGDCRKVCANDCAQNCQTYCREACVNTCIGTCSTSCIGYCSHITKY